MMRSTDWNEQRDVDRLLRFVVAPVQCYCRQGEGYTKRSPCEGQANARRSHDHLEPQDKCSSCAVGQELPCALSDRETTFKPGCWRLPLRYRRWTFARTAGGPMD